MTIVEIKKECIKLEKALAHYKAQKRASCPEAKKIRLKLRKYGHFVSGNDTREGQVDEKLLPKNKRSTQKPKAKGAKNGKTRK